MAELKCPHCGKEFSVDDTELSSIISQIRNEEFNKDVETRVTEIKDHFTEKHQLEMETQKVQVSTEIKESYEKQVKELSEQVNDLKSKNQQLASEIDSQKDKEKIAVLEATQKVEKEKSEIENQAKLEKEKYEVIIKGKDEQISYYKDLKAKMSTKMVGETLEQHCEIEFNKIRALAFPKAYFDKDNDARTGSKGDYIYRETDENGVEILSIMFEMKNEMETTATKHKNEYFFKELDKDRREKSCEYAVLVSMLEAESELYNAGIVDVSHKYEKMYVVRPQCFITIIGLLRNAALNALKYKQEVENLKNQHIDITNFEDNLMKFKDNIANNYEKAHKKFENAIDEIDKTIKHLEKVKSELLGSDNQLRIATTKVDEISIKKLTKDNPTMAAKFEKLRDSN